MDAWACLEHLLSDDGTLHLHLAQHGTQRVQEGRDTFGQCQINALRFGWNGQAGVGDELEFEVELALLARTLNHPKLLWGNFC